MTAGAMGLVCQTVGEARLVANSKLKAGKFVSQVKIAFVRDDVMASCGKQERHGSGLKPNDRLMLAPLVISPATATTLALVSGFTVPLVDCMIPLVKPMFMLPVRV